MTLIPNDYEYSRLAEETAEDGRRWVLEECVDRTEGKGVGFRVITTQRGDTVGEAYWDGNDFVGGAVYADGDEIHIEAEAAEKLAPDLKVAGFSDNDVTGIVFRAKSLSINLPRGEK